MIGKISRTLSGISVTTASQIYAFSHDSDDD